jgi:hypothetical protein
LIKAFLSKILASPNVMQVPSFFKQNIGSSTIAELLQQTAVEIEEKKAEDMKIEERVSAASRAETFSEKNVLPFNYPFLADLQDSRGQRISINKLKTQSNSHLPAKPRIPQNRFSALLTN